MISIPEKSLSFKPRTDLWIVVAVNLQNLQELFSGHNAVHEQCCLLKTPKKGYCIEIKHWPVCGEKQSPLPGFAWYVTPKSAFSLASQLIPPFFCAALSAKVQTHTDTHAGACFCTHAHTHTHFS